MPQRSCITSLPYARLGGGVQIRRQALFGTLALAMGPACTFPEAHVHVRDLHTYAFPYMFPAMDMRRYPQRVLPAMGMCSLLWT